MSLIFPFQLYILESCYLVWVKKYNHSGDIKSNFPYRLYCPDYCWNHRTFIKFRFVWSCCFREGLAERQNSCGSFICGRGYLFVCLFRFVFLLCIQANQPGVDKTRRGTIRNILEHPWEWKTWNVFYEKKM